MILVREEQIVLNDIVKEANKNLVEVQEENEELQKQNAHLNKCVREITIS